MSARESILWPSDPVVDLDLDDPKFHTLTLLHAIATNLAVIAHALTADE